MADRLSQLRKEMGLSYREPGSPGIESRTRSELLRYNEPVIDVSAPKDQDMWDEGGEEEAAPSLPPPEYVNSDSEIVLQATPGKPSARPDLYSDNYGQGSMRSTRVYAMQWIPTAADGGHVIGDVVVAFARTSRGGPNKFYVYPDVHILTWEKYRDNTGISLGSFVGGLSDYYILTPSQEIKYRELHSTSKDGLPWDNWIFEKAGLLSGRPFNSTAIGDVGRKASRAGSKRRAVESSKARKAEEREEAKRTGRRVRKPRNVSFDEPGASYRDDTY